MGILDSKSRILDVILTQEGRRQIAQGDLRIKFASFTDDATFYKKDIVSGSADATQRIYLETNSLPQDQITFEANDAGKLQPFKNMVGINVVDGKILSSSYNISDSTTIISGTNETITILNGEEFASQADSLLMSCIDNFSNLRILGTNNSLLDDKEFQLSTNDVTFTITDSAPINNGSDISEYQYLTKIESLIADARLSAQPNFLYLPPVNKSTREVLYRYRNVGQFRPLSMRDIVFELNEYENRGCVKQVKFDPTSLNNNLISQMFEITNNEIKKLDVIDYGIKPWYDYQSLTTKYWHVFFVGKVFTDDNDDDTFVHLFTLVFS